MSHDTSVSASFCTRPDWRSVNFPMIASYRPRVASPGQTRARPVSRAEHTLTSLLGRRLVSGSSGAGDQGIRALLLLDESIHGLASNLPPHHTSAAGQDSREGGHWRGAPVAVFLRSCHAQSSRWHSLGRRCQLVGPQAAAPHLATLCAAPPAPRCSPPLVAACSGRWRAPAAVCLPRLGGRHCGAAGLPSPRLAIEPATGASRPGLGRRRGAPPSSGVLRIAGELVQPPSVLGCEITANKSGD